MTLQVSYACDCAEGDVVISNEHSGARWIDPLEYRERYFSDGVIAQVEARDARVGAIISAVRGSLDRYIEWRAHR